MELETSRLRLREPDEEDLDGYAEIFADPAVMRPLGGEPRTREQTRAALAAMIAHWRDYGFGLFTVERRADGVLLGRVGLLLWDAETWTGALLTPPRGRTEIELGWTLGSAHWGNGYATEAAGAVRDWAMGELRPPRLISLIAPVNAPSIRVAEKLGMTPAEDVLIRGEIPARVYELVGAGKVPAR